MVDQSTSNIHDLIVSDWDDVFGANGIVKATGTGYYHGPFLHTSGLCPRKNTPCVVDDVRNNIGEFTKVALYTAQSKFRTQALNDPRWWSMLGSRAAIAVAGSEKARTIYQIRYCPTAMMATVALPYIRMKLNTPRFSLVGCDPLMCGYSLYSLFSSPTVLSLDIKGMDRSVRSAWYGYHAERIADVHWIKEF